MRLTPDFGRVITGSYGDQILKGAADLSRRKPTALLARARRWSN